MTPARPTAAFPHGPDGQGESSSQTAGGCDRPAQTLFAHILDIADDGVIAIDMQQRLVLFNHGAEKIFGYRADEILGESFDRLIPQRHAHSHQNYVDEFSRSDSKARLMAERREVVGQRKDGSEFPAEVSICKFQENGQLFFAAILRDISERKKVEASILEMNHQLEERVQARTAEVEASHRQLQASYEELQNKTDELRTTGQQLWQAAKLASVGELAASIAHELNNPLGTVSLRVESILAQTSPDDPRRKALEIVEQEVERMARLVANLLQFSRHGREQVSTVNVDEEILMTMELTEHYFKRRHIEVVHDIDPRMPVIFADRQKLRQVFLNLFTNAGDAMPKGGKLVIRVKRSEADRKPAVLIEVCDTGTGISPEILPHVMDPFFTTKEEGKGTGLGLAICKRIVHEHQGAIRIESEVGKGTAVRITLPVASQKNIIQLGKK